MRFIHRARETATRSHSARLRVEHLEDRTTPVILQGGFAESVFAGVGMAVVERLGRYFGVECEKD